MGRLCTARPGGRVKRDHDARVKSRSVPMPLDIGTTRPYRSACNRAGTSAIGLQPDIGERQPQMPVLSRDRRTARPATAARTRSPAPRPPPWRRGRPRGCGYRRSRCPARRSASPATRDTRAEHPGAFGDDRAVAGLPVVQMSIAQVRPAAARAAGRSAWCPAPCSVPSAPRARRPWRRRDGRRRNRPWRTNRDARRNRASPGPEQVCGGSAVSGRKSR